MTASSVVCALLENWSNWQPSPLDIQWTQMHLDRIRDGGYWGTSQGTFKLDHKAKVLTWIEGVQGEIFQKVSRIAPLIGWTVVLPEKPGEQSFSM